MAPALRRGTGCHRPFDHSRQSAVCRRRRDAAGVLAPASQLLQPADLLIPIAPWAVTLPSDDRGWHPGIFPIARLKASVDLPTAPAELDVISAPLAAQAPPGHAGGR